jgi:hypothetical protein
MDSGADSPGISLLPELWGEPSVGPLARRGKTIDGINLGRCGLAWTTALPPASPGELAQIFGGNAERVYRLNSSGT